MNMGVLFGRSVTLEPFLVVIKSDKWKNVSRYGLYEYIDEEKRVKKITVKIAREHRMLS